MAAIIKSQHHFSFNFTIEKGKEYRNKISIPHSYCWAKQSFNQLQLQWMLLLLLSGSFTKWFST